MPNNTYQAQLSTPEEDKILNELGESLSAWLRERLAGMDQKNAYSLALTTLMLFTASAGAGSNISKEAFVDMMSRYFDVHRAALKKQS